MTLARRLAQSQAARPKLILRPELLLLPQIPKPMHGMAPRIILGSQWWDETRQAAYRSTDYHCSACGVHKSQAQGPKWLEGHEVYKTLYEKGLLIYEETVPLCHYCHNSIHRGRLEALLDQRKITVAKYSAIIQHADRVLAAAGLSYPPAYNGRTAEWAKWRLVLNGKKYRPRFASMEEWLEYYGASNAEVPAEDMES